MTKQHSVEDFRSASQRFGVNLHTHLVWAYDEGEITIGINAYNAVLLVQLGLFYERWVSLESLHRVDAFVMVMG